MEIEKEQVEYLAGLAGIELSEAEKETFRNQLLRIISYVDKLNELDLSEVPPTAHTQNLTNVFREDECRPGLTKDSALALAPDRQGDYFRVPKVLRSE
ncbi:MAG: Asp-tRNA(Asn)/Glu-tRNA(Gln) amidotransferase subunit GatC [Candidatus Coatesbacteria bacterium]|nr:Asp-tRNA(Asn)/Glu-tRNA(Gln) amidotransferase subunit GatC [Candidatus Coatesbacteria bacterium]